MVTAALPDLEANQGLPPLVASEAFKALLEAVKHGRIGSECVAHSIRSEQETRACNSSDATRVALVKYLTRLPLMARRFRTRDGNQSVNQSNR